MATAPSPDVSRPGDNQAGTVGPVLTAHVEWEPPNRTLAKDLQTVGLYHAVPDQEIPDGIIPKEPGKPLCSWRGQLQPPPDGLFSPVVTCSLCVHQVARLGVWVQR
jgi:hypothetical protein